MTLKLETSTDTLTLNVPQDLDANKRLRLAVALFDAQLLTQGQAAEMTGLSHMEFYDALGRFGVTPVQYSWKEAFAETDMPEARRQRKSKATSGSLDALIAFAVVHSTIRNAGSNGYEHVK